MIRLTGIELTDVKNIHHGSLTFRPLESGGSVTGIYGQNGSGKTSVITAIQILRLLMVGAELTGDAANIFVSRTSANRRATLTATIQMDRDTICYSATLEAHESGLRVVGESLTMKSDTTRQRTLIDYVMLFDEETGLLTPRISPATAWNSITAFQHGEEILRQEATLAYNRNRSLVFSQEFALQFTRISQSLHAQHGLSAARQHALDNNLDPLLSTINGLAAFANNGIRVVTTREGASVCFGYTPFIHGGRFDILDIGRPMFVPAQIRHEIERMVEQANLVLPQVVPGLSLECDMKEDMDEAGRPGARVFLYSLHDGVKIPFWAESEGIRRIVGILSLLVRMFNETDVCIAIDELDAGIFEVLLGDILKTLAQRGKGQLIFTAHNLRILEVLEPKSIVFSTSDPSNRFVPVTNVKARNNLRDMYIRMVSLGTDGTPLASKVKPSHVAAALAQAGRVPGGNSNEK